AEARISYDRAAAALGSDRSVIRAPTGTIPETAYVALRRAGWPVTPVVDGWIAGDGGRVRLLGIDPLSTPPDLAPGGPGGAEGFLGFIAAPGRLISAPRTAVRLRVDGLPPVVISETAAPGIAFADVGVAQRLLGLEGQISRMILTGERPKAAPDLEEIYPGLEVVLPDQSADLGRLTDSFHLNLTAFGFLSFSVGLLIVHGAIGLAFEQRRPVLRTLRALGVPSRTLTLLVVAELGLLSIASGALGIVLGYGVAALLIPDVAATLRGLYGVPVEGSLVLRPLWWAAGLGIALLGTGVAAASTVWKIARLPVLAPARPRAWAQADRNLARIQALGAALLALIAIASATLGEGLIAGFTLLGALLLAGALALPLILSVLLGIVTQIARRPLAEWFWADTRQQLPGLSLALMALLLALATNIGVGTMVSSFRLTFTGWLDQRLASELYVSTDSQDQADRLQAWLASRADAVLPIWSVDGEVLGRPAEIYGVIDHATYRENWPLLEASPEVWNRLASGEAVLVNEQLARRGGLAPGDTVRLPGPWSPEVAGIYSDYGNPAGQVIIGLDALTSRYPDVERLRFGIRVAPEEAPGLARALQEEFGLNENQVSDQAALKALSLDIFERTFTVTAALNVLTLAIAGFAILTSLLTLSAMRLPQLAPAWALGLSRRDLSRLEVIRTVALAAVTFALAVPLGLVLAWVLLSVINVEAFGWRLPMHLFPTDWLRLGGLALLAACAAALWPAYKLRRTAPSQLLQVFTHER
ncbi:MAG: FtsX-like permease family protein, partial [Pseudomonadota bacterium]